MGFMGGEQENEPSLPIVHFPFLKVHGGYARATFDVHGLRDWCLGSA